MSDGSAGVLLQRAASEFDQRRAHGRYGELSADEAAELVRTLTEAALMIHPDAVARRSDALVLAQRLLADDHPEHSPLWPIPASDHCRLCGTVLYLDAVTDPRAPLWVDIDGEYATCRDRDPHVPQCW